MASLGEMSCVFHSRTKVVSVTAEKKKKTKTGAQVFLGPAGQSWPRLEMLRGVLSMTLEALPSHLCPAVPESWGYLCTQLPVPERERGGEERKEGRDRLRELAVNQGLKRELGGPGWQVFLKGTCT